MFAKSKENEKEQECLEWGKVKRKWFLWLGWVVSAGNHIFTISQHCFCRWPCLSFDWMTRLSSFKRLTHLLHLSCLHAYFLMSQTSLGVQACLPQGKSKGQVSSLNMKRARNIELQAFWSLKIKRILFAFKIHFHILGRFLEKETNCPKILLNSTEKHF